MVASVPAVSRCVQIMRLLASSRPVSLHALATQTGIPKASVLRILQTLVVEKVVSKLDTGEYLAAEVLVPARGGQADLDAEVAAALTRLATSAGQTAEWWVLSTNGLVLARRAEPQGVEVRVAARIGFLRAWGDELEAAIRVAHAWAEAPKNALAKTWLYDKQGGKEMLTKADAQALVRDATEKGYAFDVALNPNGVRRLACAVLRGAELVGVLAIAQFVPAGSSLTEDVLLPLLLAEGGQLSRNGALPYKTV